MDLEPDPQSEGRRHHRDRNKGRPALAYDIKTIVAVEAAR
jgi:hypothetical protein